MAKAIKRASESSQSPPSSLKNLVAKRIKDLRKKQGFENQEHFAWEKNLSRSLYGKYEKGANMTLDSLEKLINAFNISVKDFFSKGFDTIPDDNKKPK
ncbi:helix-turn-helix domain-containing protein [Chitinophaga defluvii]|uniref:Helix-turn-helix transcriptional regulator n=1 Tax=Chitinophaga defluvii TaxID=3163343 RepID=A0ABV2T8T3_9BACT